MAIRLTWDDAKRQINLCRHGFDIADAGEVLNSRYRLDVASQRGKEARMFSISYALGFLAVLTVVHNFRLAASATARRA